MTTATSTSGTPARTSARSASARWPRRSRRPGPRGSSGWSPSAATWPTRGPRSRRRRAHPGVCATAGVHPHEASGGIEGLEALLGRARGRRGRGVRPRLPLRPLAPGRAARGLRRAGRARPRPRPRARDPHPRGVGRDLRRAGGRPACPSAPSSTASPAARTRRGAASTSAAYLSFSGIVTFKAADELRAAAALCPLDRLLVETDSPYLAPVPHRGQAQPAGLRAAGRRGRRRGPGRAGRGGGRGDLDDGRGGLPAATDVGVRHAVLRLASPLLRTGYSLRSVPRRARPAPLRGTPQPPLFVVLVTGLRAGRVRRAAEAPPAWPSRGDGPPWPDIAAAPSPRRRARADHRHHDRRPSVEAPATDARRRDDRRDRPPPSPPTTAPPTTARPAAAGHRRRRATATAATTTPRPGQRRRPARATWYDGRHAPAAAPTDAAEGHRRHRHRHPTAGRSPARSTTGGPFGRATSSTSSPTGFRPRRRSAAGVISVRITW